MKSSHNSSIQIALHVIGSRVSLLIEGTLRNLDGMSDRYLQQVRDLSPVFIQNKILLSRLERAQRRSGT